MNSVSEHSRTAPNIVQFIKAQFTRKQSITLKDVEGMYSAQNTTQDSWLLSQEAPSWCLSIPKFTVETCSRSSSRWSRQHNTLRLTMHVLDRRASAFKYMFKYGSDFSNTLHIAKEFSFGSKLLFACGPWQHGCWCVGHLLEWGERGC